jgi:hypothetical protein
MSKHDWLVVWVIVLYVFSFVLSLALLYYYFVERKRQNKEVKRIAYDSVLLEIYRMRQVAYQQNDANTLTAYDHVTYAIYQLKEHVKE